MVTQVTTDGHSFSREEYKWETATFDWDTATGDGYTWDDVQLIKEIWTGDSGNWEAGLLDLSEKKKKKLVRLVMRRKGIKLYDEHKEVSNITARVSDIKVIIKEVKARVELV
tara:strand:+ start:117 stop:452 length:336 start_codon:yes stop_codon:yes gene_type:complete